MRCAPRSSAIGPRGWMASRSSTRPTPQSRRAAGAALRGARAAATGSSDYHGPGHRLFSFRAFELHGCEPNLGPIAHGTLAAPARGLGLCFWLTGLSGSGKSTVGRLAAGQLRDRGHRVEVLDGDDVRQNLCAGLGFSREDRDVNVRRIAWVADLLSRNGVVTFVAAVSPYRATRDEAARDGRALRGGARARLGGGVRAPRREGPLRARPGGPDPGVHRGVGPVRGAARRRADARDRVRVAGGVGAQLVEYVERRLSGSARSGRPAPSA